MRLHATSPSVTLQSVRDRVVLDLGVHVAATGGDFELRVTRPDYVSPPRAVQVDPASGVELRHLAPENLKGWKGLRRFFLVTVRTPDGVVVATQWLPFCPNGHDRQRLDDSGPIVPRYPSGCRTSLPFVRGLVWGVEGGWSVRALASIGEGRDMQPPVTLAPGAYRATVEISPVFRTLLEIPPEDAEVTLDLVVRAARGSLPTEPIPSPPGPPRAPARAPASVPFVDDPDPETLPDLVALPAWNVFLSRRGAREYLTFATSPWNEGPAPLVVEGFRRPGTTVMDAFQYFSDGTGALVGKAPAGTFDWDPRRGHLHWHFLQFVRYTLVHAKTGAAVASRKQSFCLAPTDPVDLTVPRAAYTPWSTMLMSVCGAKHAKWVRQVLPTGWADTYFQYVAGQAFDVTKLANGRYRLVVALNPDGVLHERTTENNVAVRDVTIRGKPGRRVAVAAPWEGITR